VAAYPQADADVVDFALMDERLHRRTLDARQEAARRLLIALGGGGARGLAHVGVLLELQRAGIPIAGIAGTSIGAIVGGVFAAGGEPREHGRNLARILAVAPHSPFPVGHRHRSFRDWFDTAAYLRDDIFGLGRDDGCALEAAIRAWVGQRRIEELTTPFAAVATDVRSGEVVVLDHGPLATALHASAALPGVYLPVSVGDRLLIDGGVVENVPVRTARRLPGDVVLAVSVGIDLEPVVPTTGLGLLARAEAIRAAQDEASALNQADVAIRVPLPGSVGVFDFDRATELIHRGREAMRANLERLRAALEPPVD